MCKTLGVLLSVILLSVGTSYSQDQVPTHTTSSGKSKVKVPQDLTKIYPLTNYGGKHGPKMVEREWKGEAAKYENVLHEEYHGKISKDGHPSKAKMGFKEQTLTGKLTTTHGWKVTIITPDGTFIFIRKTLDKESLRYLDKMRKDKIDKQKAHDAAAARLEYDRH